MIRRSPIPATAEAVPPAPPLQRVDSVYATTVLSGDGRSAQFYWARNSMFGQPLILLDWEVRPLDPGIWFLADSTLADFSLARQARYGVIANFVEGAALAQLGDLQGYRVQPIPEHLITQAAWPGMCRSVAMLMAEQKIGIASPAQAKMKARPFLSEAGLSSVEKRPDDPIVPAYVYGVVLGLDEASARPPRPNKVKLVA